jgi:hypothetical protein
VPEINQSIESRNFTTDVNSSYGFNQHFFIPYMFLRSNKAHKYDFFFNIRANINRPEINQMLPVTDSTNPFNTNEGNITVQNFVNYNNNWRYQRMFGLGKTLFLNGYNSFSYRPVINKNTVSKENIATSTVINFKNRIYSSTTLGFTWPIKAIKATIGADINYNFGQSYLVQNEQQKIFLLQWMWTNWSDMTETSIRTAEKMADILIDEGEEGIQDAWEIDFLK